MSEKQPSSQAHICVCLSSVLPSFLSVLWGTFICVCVRAVSGTRADTLAAASPKVTQLPSSTRACALLLCCGASLIGSLRRDMEVRPNSADLLRVRMLEQGRASTPSHMHVAPCATARCAFGRGKGNYLSRKVAPLGRGQLRGRTPNFRFFSSFCVSTSRIASDTSASSMRERPYTCNVPSPTEASAVPAHMPRTQSMMLLVGVSMPLT